jgi:hypothetical protein
VIWDPPSTPPEIGTEEVPLFELMPGDFGPGLESEEALDWLTRDAQEKGIYEYACPCGCGAAHPSRCWRNW